MSLANYLNTNNQPRCSVGKALQQFPPNDAAQLQELLDSAMSARLIAEAANACNAAELHLPFTISDQMVGHHRRSACSCFKGQ